MIELPNMASWIAAWENERDKLTDPYGIQILDMVIEHSVIEAERDWDALMSTIHDDAVYQFAGLQPDRVNNREQMREVYEESDRKVLGSIGGTEQEMDQ